MFLQFIKFKLIQHEKHEKSQKLLKSVKFSAHLPQTMLKIIFSQRYFFQNAKKET